jgi:hypothetical protein
MTKPLMLASEDRFLDTGKEPPMELETGSGFGWYDRMFFGYTIDNPDLVFTYTDWEARDLQAYLKKDYKAKQIMNVLQLPIEYSERNFVAGKGDSGEFEWLQEYWQTDSFSGGCKVPLDYIISQATSAVAYKNAYFEKVFTHDDDGKIVYDTVAFRPQTTCRVLRDLEHAKFQGFEQEPYYLSVKENKTKPIFIPKERAYVYMHGHRNDPINGTSDLEVPYWCYKTKQKIMLLWFQFLEGVSLPRLMVGAQELGVAQGISQQISKAKNSGVVPYAMQGGSNNVKIDAIDASGKGADQFVTAISWLDGSAVDSILAGFLNLTGTAAARGFNATGGSYALSKDASDFFLQSLEAKSRELAFSLRKDLFAPLIRYNFGKNSVVPGFKFEPLNDEDKSSSIALLQAMIAAPAGSPNPVPTEFVSTLAEQVSDYLGLDGAMISKAFSSAAAAAKTQAAQMGPQGASPIGQQVAGVAGAVNAAQHAVTQANTPTSATSGAAQVTSAHGKALLAALGAA